MSITDEVVGMIGFDPFKYLEAHEKKDWSITYYSYSLSKIFDKSHYFYSAPGIFEKAIDDGYIVITDGIFDCLSLTALGYNVAALLGSLVSDAIAAQLRFVKKVIVAMDNDEAGLKLYRSLIKVHPGTCWIKQGQVKDADDILKTDLRERYLKVLDEAIKCELPLNFSLKSNGRDKFKKLA